MPPKPSTTQSCNTHNCAPECAASRGSAQGRFCNGCSVSCTYWDCYFLFDRGSGEFHHFWGAYLGVSYSWSPLYYGGYQYNIGPSQLWYDGYEWVWNICRTPM